VLKLVIWACRTFCWAFLPKRQAGFSLQTFFTEIAQKGFTLQSLTQPEFEMNNPNRHLITYCSLTNSLKLKAITQRFTKKKLKDSQSFKSQKTPMARICNPSLLKFPWHGLQIRASEFQVLQH
jgi:hypothetical protein